MNEPMNGPYRPGTATIDWSNYMNLRRRKKRGDIAVRWTGTDGWELYHHDKLVAQGLDKPTILGVLIGTLTVQDVVEDEIPFNDQQQETS